jgi:hypothetical protein
MSSEARKKAARERVRKWKEAHPKSVKWQKERWYARRVEALKGAREKSEPLLEKVVVAPKKEGTHYGELVYGPIKGIDIPYEEQAPKAALPVVTTPKVIDYERQLPLSAEEQRLLSQIDRLRAHKAGVVVEGFEEGDQ